MRKVFILSIMVSLFVTGCGGNSKSDLKENSPSAKNEISIEATEVDKTNEIKTIMSTAPSNTEVLIGLGVGDLIIAVDNYSPTEELKGNVEIVDFLEFDSEKIIEMNPDIIFSVETNYIGNENPFKLIEEAGIEVVKVPTATSISQISDTIILIGDKIEKQDEANKIVESLEMEIENIKKIGNTIENKKNVYLEIGDYDGVLYTAGENTFLDDILNIIGANNIFSDLESWSVVSSEVIVEKNPDLIVTNNSYDELAVERIVKRNGFESVNAVMNNEVKLVDVNSTSRGSQNIIVGIRAIAEAVYPEVYDFEE